MPVMKIKSLYHCLILAVLGMTIMSSCQKDPITGSVTGVVTVYDPSSPLVKTPLAGIKVYVINTDYKLDSADYANNEAAVVGSGVTASDGSYQIIDIDLGNYAVIPVPDLIMYRFEPDSDLDTVRFSIREGSLDHTVDFKGAISNSADDGFHIRVTIINRPSGGSITLYRPIFLFNIVPTFNVQKIDNVDKFTGDDFTLDFHFGIFCALYAVSNNFKIYTHDLSNKYLFPCWIEYNYFNTPANSHWQIDWSAQTSKRIE